MRPLFSAVVLLLFVASAEAQTRRALMVGINTYKPEGASVEDRGSTARTWKNLEGTLNDVEVLRSVLLSKYGFAASNVRTLTEAEASHEGIKTAINDLARDTGPGDIVLFYYAGHGSYAVNERSDEIDRQDETIVPSDSYKGASDIRDKELRVLFSKFYETMENSDAELILIFDSCHSGSITRGAPSSGRARYIEPTTQLFDEIDALPPPPQDEGAIVISSARANEPALEILLEDGRNHGIFTWALAEALRTMPATVPAKNLFSWVRAKMRATGITSQEPVISGRDDRLNQPLFGGAEGDPRFGRTTVPVIAVQRDGTVVLQGGYALGLRPQTELEIVALDEDESNAPTVRLAVEEVSSLTRSTAKIIEGKADHIAENSFFRVSSWVSPPEQPLRLWIPPTCNGDSCRPEDIRSIREKLRTNSDVTWVDDPSEMPPSYLVRWDGAQWQLDAPGNATKGLGPRLDATLILSELNAQDNRGSSIYILLPPSPDLRKSLEEEFANAKIAAQLTDSDAAGSYWLAGQLDDRGARYAWVLPAATHEGVRPPLPPRSDWLDANGDLAQALRIRAESLDMVWSWMHLPSPDDDGSFPYWLELENTRSGDRKAAGDTLRFGEQYRVLLTTSEDALKEARYKYAGARERHFYLFVIDQTGKSQILYGNHNEGNRLSVADEPPRELTLLTVNVGAPEGNDTFFLLTTSDPLPDPSVLSFDGIDRGTRGNVPNTPLSRLLDRTREGTRGEYSTVTPANWSIMRIPVHSLPPTN